MAIDTTWTNPTSTDVDLGIGDIVTEGTWDKVISNLNVLGGSDGKTPSQGQITFPASQNASADANTFDDYEEGSWTPTVAGSATAGTQTYGTQSGTYTKIGNMVYCSFSITLTVFDGATNGNIEIRGLPFTVRNATGVESGLSIQTIREVTLPTAGIQFSGGVSGNSTHITLSAPRSATTELEVTQAEMENTTVLRGSVAYRV